ERADRELRREPLAVVIEVRGDRRLRAPRGEAAPPRVERVAAALCEHAALARAGHAGRDVAGAQAVAHELALEVARRGAPAVGPEARGDRDQPRAALRGPRCARDANKAAEARADEGHRGLAPDAIEPRRDQVGEAERG